jgi:hypothetical protein
MIKVRKHDLKRAATVLRSLKNPDFCGALKNAALYYAAKAARKAIVIVRELAELDTPPISK